MPLLWNGAPEERYLNTDDDEASAGLEGCLLTADTTHAHATLHIALIFKLLHVFGTRATI